MLSWAVCPVVMAIVALVFASKAKTAIEASNGWLDGQGMVTAAKIIAWINIVFAVLGTIFFIIFFLFVGSASIEQSTTDAMITLLG